MPRRTTSRGRLALRYSEGTRASGRRQTARNRPLSLACTHDHYARLMLESPGSASRPRAWDRRDACHTHGVAICVPRAGGPLLTADARTAYANGQVIWEDISVRA